MQVRAQVHNQEGRHEVRLTTDNQCRTLTVPPKLSGFGSSASGGELLFLALATCYCNDVYREAAKQGITIQSVEVTVEGEFGEVGEPARSVTYSARVTARASEQAIQSLMRATDQVAEIQNTLRKAIPVTLAQVEAVSI